MGVFAGAGDGRVVGELPAVPEVPKFSARFRRAHLDGGAALQCGSRDYRVDGSGAWAVCASGVVVAERASIHEKTKHFEPIEDDENKGRNAGFRMSSHAPSANSAPYKLLGVYGEPITTTIDFVLPNRRYETIRAGEKWFASLTTVTPVTASTCRIDVYSAWNVFYWVPFVTPIAKFFGARFVRQDQETMMEQARGVAVQSGADADR